MALAKVSIPSSTNDRNKQAIDSIKAAISSPRDPSFRLIETEFPALQALNKLGDGSLKSAMQAEEANLEFAVKLIQSLGAPLPFLPGPKIFLLLSSAASKSFCQNAAKKVGSSCSVQSLKDGLPEEISSNDICIFLTPSAKSDYVSASTIASEAKASIVVNGFAKDPRSIKSGATMAYFLKPLTYNSQVAGYLIRKYPSDWVTIDALSKQSLGTFTDDEILVKNTNTPDLRESVRIVQKSVDERVIQMRRGS